MQNFSFENQGTNTYLVYRLQEGDQLDSISLGMLKNNRISGLAPILFTQMNEDRFLKYNITAKRSVSSFLLNTVNRKRLLSVFLGILTAFSAAEDYMIDPRLFVLELDNMFIDVTTCEILIICLPVEQPLKKDVDLAALFKRMILNISYDQSENTDYIGRVISYLNGPEAFSVSGFTALVRQLLGNAAPPMAQPMQQSQPPVAQPMPQMAQSMPQMAQPMPQMAQPQPAAPMQPQNVPPQPAQKPVPPPMQQNAVPKPVNRPQNAIPGGAIPNRAGASVAVPNGGRGAQLPPRAAALPDDDGEEITLMYLLQHYNKENKAKYDAQKARKKAAKGGAPVRSAMPVPGGQPVPRPAQNAVPVPNRQPLPAQNAVPMPNPQPVPSAQGIPAMVGAAPQQIPQPMPQQIPQPMAQPMQLPPQPGAPADFGGTTVLSPSYSEGTTVLSESAAPQPTAAFLIRLKSGERIPITGARFRIGKERSQVEYFIGDNTAISRNHADIVCKGDACSIVDVGSTNHTYVNGSQITSHTEVPLKSGDKLRLANEEFEFTRS